MREIKFRAWWKIESEMVSSELINNMIDGKAIVVSKHNPLYNAKKDAPWDSHIAKAIKGNPFTTEEFILMQFTGLKDKNGKEIYEGDIVKTEISKGDVQFSHGMFGVEWVTTKESKSMVGAWGQKHNLRRLDDGFNLEIEVIGNIHESPIDK